jgi:hypothetical protein
MHCSLLLLALSASMPTPASAEPLYHGHQARALRLAARRTPDTRKSIAVLDVQAPGLDATLLPSLTELVSSEVNKSDQYRVISSRDIQTLLGFEKQKELVGCDDATCITELVGALGVDQVIATQIGTLRDLFIVNLKLVNVRTAAVESRVSDTVRGEEALIDSLRTAVANLLGGIRLPSQEARSAPEAKTAEAPSAKALPSVRDTAPAQAGPLILSRGALGLTIAGGVAVAAGAVAGVLAKRDESCANDLNCIGGETAAQRAPREASIANVGFIGGGIAFTAGLIWLIASSHREPQDPVSMLVPTFAPSKGPGVAYALRF